MFTLEEQMKSDLQAFISESEFAIQTTFTKDGSDTSILVLKDNLGEDSGVGEYASTILTCVSSDVAGISKECSFSINETLYEIVNFTDDGDFTEVIVNAK
ncbi:MAG: hypothetical protein J7L21_02875 [Sulfurimonas sp.]|nr:hypothetical protein [Sulfurimonas sp.]